MTEPPGPRTDDDEYDRYDNRGRRSHEGENADTPVIRLAGGAQQGKGRHVGSEEGGQKQHRPDGPRRDEVVLSRAGESPVTQETDGQHRRDVKYDDRQSHGASSFPGVFSIPRRRIPASNSAATRQ